MATGIVFHYCFGLLARHQNVHIGLTQYACLYVKGAVNHHPTRPHVNDGHTAMFAWRNVQAASALRCECLWQAAEGYKIIHDQTVEGEEKQGILPSQLGRSRCAYRQGTRRRAKLIPGKTCQVLRGL